METIDKVKQMIADGIITQNDAAKYFPEFKNRDKNDRIRKAIFDILLIDNDEIRKILKDNNLLIPNIYGWLEEQAEHAKARNKIQLGKKYKCIASPRYSTFMKGLIYRPSDEFLCSLMNFCSDCFEPMEDNDQKPTEKVEPKFHEGEWVVTSYGKVNQVVSVDKDGDGYTLDDGVYFSGSWCDMYHPWTIQDAKDGDVIIVGDEDGTGIAIYGKNDKIGNNILYCCYDDENDFAINTPLSLECLLYPATKEQRNLLFQKMKEAGYEWDAEKKELKKVKQKSAWSEESIAAISRTISIVKWAAYSDHSHPILNDEGATELVERLNFIKDRVQPMQEWSEEDINLREATIGLLNLIYPIDAKSCGKSRLDCIDWLRSLRPQDTWKPSDEQMKILKELVEDNNQRYFYTTLKSLYEQLKKLKNE